MGLFVRLLRKLGNYGSAAIEFAIIAPVVFLLLMGMTEFGVILFVQSVLEGANTAGSRIGLSGFTQLGMTREEYIRSEVYRLSGRFLSPNRLTIEILTYPSFGNIGQPEPCIQPANPPCPGVAGVNYIEINGNGRWDTDMGAASAGGSGDVVVYRTTYAWQIATPLLWPVFGDGLGNYSIVAVSTVRNEAL